ncbi:MAG: GTP 3',8-cyclase MoaA family protein, partial [Planctomycetota bacterium]
QLSRTLAGIEEALRHGLTPVKLNTVVLRPYNVGELSEIARFGLNRGCQVRCLELMPIGSARAIHGEMFVSAREMRARLGEAFSMTALPRRMGQTSRNFAAADGHGTRGIIGLISPQSRPFCAGCTRIRLTSSGRLVACLARGKGPDLRPYLRDASAAARRALGRIVARELAAKAGGGTFRMTPPMAAVGG